ncbi:hypothetical protein [Teredinibacter purpureus]|uniref:hypothetical protein n=1 Tax=Teredinibacter purpureus TaxID=2731756 RepID=UPI0006975C8C|nr:hypothetical protein [Teredinibacter purpureus]
MQFPDSSVPLYSVVESDLSSVTAAVAEPESRRERRDQSKPIPMNVAEYINDDQVMSLRNMESFGWQLAFVRRPLFQDAVVVVVNADQSQYGVLESDGSINMKSMLELRH